MSYTMSFDSGEGNKKSVEMPAKVYGTDKTTGGHFTIYQCGLKFYYEPVDKSLIRREGHYSEEYKTYKMAQIAAQAFENEYFR